MFLSVCGRVVSSLLVYVCVSVFMWQQRGRSILSVDIEHPQLPLASTL